MSNKIIEALEADGSRLAKEKILEEAWHSGNRSLFMGFKLAYDSMITFGVKQVPISSASETTFSWSDFLNLTDKLRRRELTGHAARDAIKDACNRTEQDLWNRFYRRVLLKDLKCGVTNTTVNKILKKVGKNDPTALDFIIDVFELQLAVPREIEEVSGKVFADPKLDGIRIAAILDKENRTVTLYTRNGRINTNFTYVEQNLLSILDKVPYSLVLDGEMIGTSFQNLMKQVNRKQSIDTKDMKFGIFDCLPLEDFKKGMCNTPLHARHSNLLEINELFSSFENIFAIPKLQLDLTTEEGRKELFKLNMDFVTAGYEGIMLKYTHSPYERKRNQNWIKIKPVIEVTLKIVAVEESTEGKRTGLMKSLICEGEDLGYKIRVSVGGGYNDEQVREFWERRHEIIGHLVEVKADVVTKDQSDDEWYSLRFPRFKCFRSIDEGEKI